MVWNNLRKSNNYIIIWKTSRCHLIKSCHKEMMKDIQVRDKHRGICLTDIFQSGNRILGMKNFEEFKVIMMRKFAECPRTRKIKSDI